MQQTKLNIEDRVTCDDSDKVGVVMATSREIQYPGRGPTRKVWVCFPGDPETWFWEFQLEVW
jgi:hypothetical protein